MAHSHRTDECLPNGAEPADTAYRTEFAGDWSSPERADLQLRKRVLANIERISRSLTLNIVPGLRLLDPEVAGRLDSGVLGQLASSGLLLSYQPERASLRFCENCELALNG